MVFEQVLNSSKNVKSKSSENIDQLQALLDKHQERQEALLHLEYNKLTGGFQCTYVCCELPNDHFLGVLVIFYFQDR